MKCKYCGEWLGSNEIEIEHAGNCTKMIGDGPPEDREKLYNENEELKSELSAYKLLLDSAHMILLNANDFFGWACADAVELDVTDLSWVIPIVQKYGGQGIEACMSYIRKCKPIDLIIDEKFEQIYKELEELKPKVWSEDEK